MGNKNASQFSWEEEYTVLEKNFNDGTLVLQKEGSNRQYLGREIVCTDKKEAAEIKRLIHLKTNNSNPFLTHLSKVYYNEDAAYCSTEDKVYLLFEKPPQTLKEQILARKFANERFSEEEADVILESGIKAIKHLKQINHPHGNISSSSIFIDKNRRIVVGDPWITPPSYSQEINQNAFACPSPEKILLQNDQITEICPYRSDLFSLGAVVLEAINFQHMDVLYEKGFRRVLDHKVQEKLSKIKNEQFRYRLSLLLAHDPRNRDAIYSQYRSAGISGSEVKHRAMAQILSNAQQIPTSSKTTKDESRLTPTATTPPPVRQNLYPPPPTSTTLNSRPTPAIRFGSGPDYHIPKDNHTPSSFTNNYTPSFSKGKYDNILAYEGRPENREPNTQWNTKFSSGKHYDSYKPINTLQQRPWEPYVPPVSQNGYNFEMKPKQPPTIPFGVENKLRPHQNQIRYPEGFHSSVEVVNNSANLTTYLSITQDNKRAEPILQHTSNYHIKDNSSTNPIDSLQLDIREEHSQQGRKSENSDRGFLDAVNEAQNSNPILEVTETPDRRPKKRQNSTIKEVDENDYSDSRDQSRDTETIFVEQSYERGRYVGEKKRGLRNGKGKFYYNEGSVYDGQWKDNQMDGKGILYYSNGKVAYDGQWRRDEFHGFGKVLNEDQLPIQGGYNYENFDNLDDYWAYYEGNLSSDRRHGVGMIKFSNNEIFKGTFDEDVVEGEGKFFTFDGKVIHGIWSQNKLVKRFEPRLNAA